VRGAGVERRRSLEMLAENITKVAVGAVYEDVEKCSLFNVQCSYAIE
jgi:hypothetical protein